jgi:hypothetical protein
MGGGELRVELFEEGADGERLDTLTGFLREELLRHDVDDVTALRGGQPPPGARAFDVLAVGGLLVNLGRSAAGLRDVVAAIRKWLVREDGTRRAVRLQIGDDVLDLSDATAADQERLIDLFVARHATIGGDAKWPAGEKP